MSRQFTVCDLRILIEADLKAFEVLNLRASWADVSPTNNYAHPTRMGDAMQQHTLFLYANDAC